MFCRISQNVELLFLSNFSQRHGGHPTLFSNKQKGGFPMKFGTFGPLEIGGVGDKHPHDSDHAEYNFPQKYKV